MFDPRVRAILLAAAKAPAGPTDSERGAVPLPDGLTHREMEVLTLVADGPTHPEIAERLFLSTNTIETHINRIFAKTGSGDRVAAIGYAHRHHVVPGP